jgi:hypothetical protein
LTSLELSGCDLGEAGALALAASPYVNNLRRLVLFEFGLSHSARRVLKKRFGGAFVFGV